MYYNHESDKILTDAAQECMTIIKAKAYIEDGKIIYPPTDFLKEPIEIAIDSIVDTIIESIEDLQFEGKKHLLGLNNAFDNFFEQIDTLDIN